TQGTSTVGRSSLSALRPELVRLVDVVRTGLELLPKLLDGPLERLDLLIGCPLVRDRRRVMVRVAARPSLVGHASLQRLDLLVHLLDIIFHLVVLLRVDDDHLSCRRLLLRGRFPVLGDRGATEEQSDDGDDLETVLHGLLFLLVDSKDFSLPLTS